MNRDHGLDREVAPETGVQVAREQQIFRWILALDSGDEWAMEQILELAQDDAELERLIGEVQLAWLQEQGLEPLQGAELAVELGQKSLSQPPAPTVATSSGQLNVSEVAELLLSQGTTPAEAKVLSQLAQVKELVPASLSRADLQRLARELNVLPDKRFWRRFKDAAIALWMQRTTPQSQLALAREEKGRNPASTTDALSSDKNADTNAELDKEQKL